MSPLPQTASAHPSPQGMHPRLLITSGPTHEPIDAVRFIGNRSSGRLGAAIADEAANRSWSVRSLVGPNAVSAASDAVETHRFQTTSDLGILLEAHQSWCSVLIMAAAVADYRPASPDLGGKIRREPNKNLTIELEPTPDLLAGCAERRTPDQLLIGFALEPADRLEASARGKLERKKIDLIVANPLETMDSGNIEARLLSAPGFEPETDTSSGLRTKQDFAAWLLDRIESILQQRHSQGQTTA